MKTDSELTIEAFARRSSGLVLAFTFFMAVTGPLLGSGSVSWGMWVPFCFITIPTIHRLCQESMRLRQRVSDLEKKLESRESRGPRNETVEPR